MSPAASVPRLAQSRPGVRTPPVWACLVAGGLVAAAAAAIAVSASDAPSVWMVIGRAAIAGIPVAVGVYAWGRRGSQRLGLLLVGAGGGLLVTTLAESSDPTAYAVGRGAGWIMEAVVVYLFLAYPTGRLPERPDRFLAGAMGLVVAALYLPLLLIGITFPAPSPYGSCTSDCPTNAFFSLGSEPAFVDAVMRPLGVFLATAVMTAVVVRLWQRLQEASPLARRMLAAVVAVALARVSLAAAALPIRLFDTEASGLEVVAWLIALCAPAMALAILVGLLRWDMYAAGVIRRLAAGVRSRPNATTLRRVMAEAFGDPGIRIVFPVRGGAQRWRDEAGLDVELPEPGTGLAASEVQVDGQVVAAVIHDDVLSQSPELIEAGTALASVALENERLAGEARSATREARSARRRMAAAAERERRRIERDLHDSAQQRLVALRIELELAEELVRTDPERGAERLRELEGDVEATLDELRSLAHGVYPPLLADRGLEEALRGATAHSAIPVDIGAHDVRRYSPEVESAVYFCVLEALQNALKHAHAHRVRIHLDGGRLASLQFTVRDDGTGAPGGQIHPGAGIANMEDRLSAVEGTFEIVSTPAVGTVVRGTVPTLAG